MRYFDRTIRQPYSRTIVVWVLTNRNGHTEYFAGENAVPPIGRAHDVVARLGPFAYEEGLAPFREQIEELAKEEQDQERKRQEEESLMARVRREIESKMPPPAEQSPPVGDSK